MCRLFHRRAVSKLSHHLQAASVHVRIQREQVQAQLPCHWYGEFNVKDHAVFAQGKVHLQKNVDPSKSKFCIREGSEVRKLNDIIYA
jgi:hypothetical protein